MMVRFIIFMLFSAQAVADNRETVRGLWSSDGSIFKVYELNNALFGQIVALNEPAYTVDENPEKAGQPRVDALNPDPNLRSQPILGLHMFKEYQFEDGQWQGSIYDPESGKTYQSKMKISVDGRLEIRGYVGIPMFGRTAVFEPVSTCSERIVKMLQMTKYGDAC
jgi:uncharacterized protein (DUF2147 family)